MALPLGYEIFRMGYFAALVPNTAFAKEASAGYWRQGWRYTVDFFGAYYLLVPLAGATAWASGPVISPDLTCTWSICWDSPIRWPRG